MIPTLLLAALVALGYLILFAGAEVSYRFAGLPSEWSRKFLHVTGGSVSLLLPRLFHSFWWILLLAVLFAALLAATKRFGLLHSVHKVERPSVGSVIFPLPVLLCFMLMEYRHDALLFYLPVAVLTFADPAAFAVGQWFPWRPYRIGKAGKTLGGSLAFAAVAFLLCMWTLSGENRLPAAIAVTMCATLAEAVSGRGFDNLTVPLVVAVVLLAGMQETGICLPGAG